MTIARTRELLPEETKNMTDTEVEKMIDSMRGLADSMFELYEREVKKIGIKTFREKYKPKITTPS